MYNISCLKLTSFYYCKSIINFISFLMLLTSYTNGLKLLVLKYIDSASDNSGNRVHFMKLLASLMALLLNLCSSVIVPCVISDVAIFI